MTELLLENETKSDIVECAECLQEYDGKQQRILENIPESEPSDIIGHCPYCTKQ